jgi:lysophospholipase L1-like esterase
MNFKNLIAGFILCNLFAIAANSQPVKWDSTHRPGSYALRVDQFKSFPNSKKDVVFLGNSITERVDWNELLRMKRARNRGISGDITFGVLERLHEVTEGKPAKVFILIGINDISRNIPDSVIVDNYKKIISRIKRESPGTKIYFQTIMPVNNEFLPLKNQYNKDEHIFRVNEQLKLLGRNENITVIDLHPHFLGADKKLNKRFTEDGLHLNAEGYKLWAKVLHEGRYLK